MNKTDQHNASRLFRGVRIQITGIVQGVGFRPFVYSIANKNHLVGWVRNTSGGVDVEINGLKEQVDRFIHQLQTELPPLARIDEIIFTECEFQPYESFSILTSLTKPGDFIPISPDVSICEDCKQELFTITDRRYRYPFINCTNCGPRFTIIKDIPYDRPKTTMESFEMCADCKREYENPLDRRFHAQPIACPRCGPQVRFISNLNKEIFAEDAIKVARQWLKDGKIIAIKGLGGFHLACDATNTAAVKTLRSRKKRSDKPFALMGFDIGTIKKHCQISKEEEILLSSRQRPVVLLKKLKQSSISEDVAPMQMKWGMMLPYTPLHLLLLEPEENYPEILVMTSGNISEEPIAYLDDDALTKLSDLADGYLIHDRPIHMRTDDSVIRSINLQPYMIRRSRGYTPDSIPFPFLSEPILAAGAELKNTFCITRDAYAFMSHHIGDLENYETFLSFAEGIDHFLKIFKIEPKIISCDLHPNYLSTQFAAGYAEKNNLHLLKVQHHHAHLASCLAEKGWQKKSEKVIGVIFDGTGMGTDNAIWGGEILYGNYQKYVRKFHLEYLPLPGGDAAIKNPARIALAYLWKNGLDWSQELPPVMHICEENKHILKAQLTHSINTINTSSMGRLFDAVSSLIGLCQLATYEGQPAIELEAIADLTENQLYEFDIDNDQIKIGSLLENIINDWVKGIRIDIISSRFHNSIVSMAVKTCQQITSETGCKDVVLSGGVWQNEYLLTRTVKRLQSMNYNVMIHERIPANDGGISLGQAAIAAAWKYGQ